LSAVLEQVEYVSIEKAIPMRRVWAMPSHSTFDIPPIRALVKSYLYKSKVSVDPFARNKRWSTYTNDLNPETAADSHLEASEFLRDLAAREVVVDLTLFDPPYSLRQCAEVYESVGRPVTMIDTQIFGRWTEHKKLIADMTAPGGYAICFGWNSQGIGPQNNYRLIEMLIVCHGGAHNDTIVTVERKVESKQDDLFGAA